MRDYSEDELQVFKLLRGVFNDLTLGGSGALRCSPFDIDSEDLDFFVRGDRLMETWATVKMLEAIGFTVYSSGMDRKEDGNEYDIKGQWHLIRMSYEGVDSDIPIDLIFIKNGTSLSSIMCSDLSKILVTIDYSPKGYSLQRADPKVLARLFGGECAVDVSNATEAHLDKLQNRCYQLGLTLTKTYEVKEK